MTVYFIDKSLYFNSDKMILINKENNKSSKLYSTTSSLLLLLVIKHGEVLSKDFVLKNVWLDLDVVVTEGSYYQAITHLRKKIRELGCSIDFIQTIPRRGIVIPRSVKIRVITEGLEIQKIQEIELSKEINEAPEIHKIERLQESEEVHKVEEIIENQKLHDSLKTMEPLGGKKKFFLIFFALSFLFLLVFLFFRHKNVANNEWEFGTYKEYKSGGKCHVFLNDANNTTGIDDIVGKGC
ncbi:hypothetical protein C6J46_004741, partial [Salmonella enterica subsp. enterica serovar Javiana]|nr:hypothetical protein [Salmonella enterica subsp. enterica serovar Javiana]